MQTRPLLLAALFSTSCAGPERGFVGEHRGRTQVIHDLDDAGHVRDASAGSAPLFPLAYVEKGGDGFFCEVIWPIFELGHGPPSAEGPPEYFRLWPIIFVDSFRDYSRVAIFPIYFHVRESLESGDRSIDHFWPLYGVHREWIDLAPAVTHHFLFPLIFFRHGWNQWKVHLFPVADVSNGYLDRGWWLLPVIKSGGHGQSSFFYLLDPLFAYERDSIAESEADETPERFREGWRVLGGLVGWENDRGRRSLRLLWLHL